MITVKDKLAKGYKGRPTLAIDKECPCKPCYNPHETIYGMVCISSYLTGCPTYVVPVHIFYEGKEFKNRRVGDILKCRRCGEGYEVGKVNFVSYRRLKELNSLRWWYQF